MDGRKQGALNWSESFEFFPELLGCVPFDLVRS